MPTEIKKAIRSAAGWAANQSAMEALYGVGGYYTTLSAWEAGEQRDLVAANQIATAVCYNDWPSGLNDSSINIFGWVYDSTRHIKITVAEGHRHSGSFGTGFYTTSADDYTTFFIPRGAVVEYMAFKHTGMYGTAVLGDMLAKNLLLASTNSSGAALTQLSSYSTLINCLAIDSVNGFVSSSGGAPTLYNCVAANCGTGFSSNGSGAATLLKNCLAYNCTTPYSGTFSSGSTNNASSSGTPPGTSPVTGVTSAAFVDAAGKNFHLSSGSVLRGAGVNLYSTFTTDIDGDVRPSSGAWDIGFDQYAVVASYPTLTSLGVVPGSTTARFTVSVTR